MESTKKDLADLVKDDEQANQQVLLHKLDFNKMVRFHDYVTTDNDKKARKEAQDWLVANEKPLRDAIAGFKDDLGKLASQEIHTDSGKRINYVREMLMHVAVTQTNPGTIEHDMDILISELLSFLYARALNNKNDKGHLKVATSLLTSVYQHFGTYLAKVHEYQNVLPPPKSPKIDDAVAAALKVLQGPIHEEVQEKTVEDVLHKASALIVSTSKPVATSYQPSGSWINHHGHGLNNYDPDYIVEGGVKWEALQGKLGNVEQAFVMPIPHHVQYVADKDPELIACCSHDESEKDPMVDYAYYTDPAVVQCHFANYDRTLVAEYNKLDAKEQELVTIAGTGIHLLDPKGLQHVREVAGKFAYAVAKAKIEAGMQHIEITYGELTGNKTQVSQAMLGSTKPEKFIEDAAALLTAVYLGGADGLARAMGEAKDAVSAQIRIVFHNDTEGPGVRLDTLKLSDKDEAHRQILQPTIHDVQTYVGKVDANLAKEMPNIKVKIGFVLQIAHLIGVTVSNWGKVDAKRTESLLKFFQAARQLKSLRVLSDTSWLTASARYANNGMGRFLMQSDDALLKGVGRNLIIADRISNDCFMFMLAGERYFQARKVAGDNTVGTITGLALTRAAAKKVFEAYYRQLGAIYDALRKEDKAINKLEHYILSDAMKAHDTLSEGNFIGLLYKLYRQPSNSYNPEVQDAMPFVWGADGLTQFTERSGAEKYKIYRDQHCCEAVIEMLGQGGEAAEEWTTLLNDMRVGPKRDQVFWAKDLKAQIKVAEELLADAKVSKASMPIRAAMALVRTESSKPEAKDVTKPNVKT